MTQLTPFNFDGRELRAISIDGDPWFLAGDTCSHLDLNNVGQALASLDDDEKSSITIADGTPGNPTRSIISESGLYSLILRSRKPEAKAFKRWVTHEVLPSIRKTGGYLSPEASEDQLDRMLSRLRVQAETLALFDSTMLHPDHKRAYGAILAARLMGEKPELDPVTRPLYAQDYLKEKGAAGKRLRSISPTFGKRVKAAFVLQHGRDPEKFPMTTGGGHVREVNAYTEADRPLMDKVWNEHYAAVTA